MWRCRFYQALINLSTFSKCLDAFEPAFAFGGVLFLKLRGRFCRGTVGWRRDTLLLTHDRASAGVLNDMNDDERVRGVRGQAGQKQMATRGRIGLVGL